MASFFGDQRNMKRLTVGVYKNGFFLFMVVAHLQIFVCITILLTVHCGFTLRCIDHYVVGDGRVLPISTERDMVCGI